MEEKKKVADDFNKLVNWLRFIGLTLLVLLIIGGITVYQFMNDDSNIKEEVTRNTKIITDNVDTANEILESRNESIDYVIEITDSTQIQVDQRSSKRPMHYEKPTYKNDWPDDIVDSRDRLDSLLSGEFPWESN